MYRNFFNTTLSYPVEKIIIDRSAIGKEDECLSSEARYPGIKDEATKLLGNGYMIKRCLPVQYSDNRHLNSVKDTQLIGNVYMYKHLL